jgi:hypothetical protein
MRLLCELQLLISAFGIHVLSKGIFHIPKNLDCTWISIGVSFVDGS